MKFYELNCLLSPKLNIDEIKALTKRIFSFGEKIENESLKKINLAYPIKKEREAFLYSASFESSEKPGDFEKRLKSENEILRFRIFSKKEKKLPSREIPLARRVPLAKKPSALAKEKLPKKVKIEEIEKKLEEILGET